MDTENFGITDEHLERYAKALYIDCSNDEEYPFQNWEQQFKELKETRKKDFPTDAFLRAFIKTERSKYGTKI